VLTKKMSGGFLEKTVVLRFSDSVALSIKAPQLVGILAGVIVFTLTIAVVVYLMFKSGSISKFLEEMQQNPRNATTRGSAGFKSQEPGASGCTPPPQYDTRPELYEHLLEAAKTLPLQPAPPQLEGRNMSVRALDLLEDVDLLVEASNGSAQYHESAYDPVTRIWGWLSLNPPSIFYQGEELPSHGQGEAAWPFASKDAFLKHFGVPPANGTHLVIVDEVVKKPVGMISLVSNQPSNLAVRLDNIWLTPAYQGDARRMAHETVLLLLTWLTESGYRRITCEVDLRHVVMRKFVERCGFTSEAVLRKHRVVSRRNRDTALYVLLNSDWTDAQTSLKIHLGIDPKPKKVKAAEIEPVAAALSAAKKKKE
jgi:RimJ/RimL family protein N-acetyltransferase